MNEPSSNPKDDDARLAQSAELYAEVYAEDADLRELTEQAVEGWPE